MNTAPVDIAISILTEISPTVVVITEPVAPNLTIEHFLTQQQFEIQRLQQNIEVLRKG